MTLLGRRQEKIRAREEKPSTKQVGVTKQNEKGKLKDMDGWLDSWINR